MMDVDSMTDEQVIAALAPPANPFIHSALAVQSVRFPIITPENVVLTGELSQTPPLEMVREVLPSASHNPATFAAVLWRTNRGSVNYYHSGSCVSTGAKGSLVAQLALVRFVNMLKMYKHDDGQPRVAPASWAGTERIVLEELTPEKRAWYLETNRRFIRLRNLCVQNVVACMRTGVAVELNDIRREVPGSLLQPENFPGCIDRKEDAKGKNSARLYFACGAVNFTGKRSMAEVQQEAYEAARVVWNARKALESRMTEQRRIQMLMANNMRTSTPSSASAAAAAAATTVTLGAYVIDHINPTSNSNVTITNTITKTVTEEMELLKTVSALAPAECFSLARWSSGVDFNAVKEILTNSMDDLRRISGSSTPVSAASTSVSPRGVRSHSPLPASSPLSRSGMLSASQSSAAMAAAATAAAARTVAAAASMVRKQPPTTPTTQQGPQSSSSSSSSPIVRQVRLHQPSAMEM